MTEPSKPQGEPEESIEDAPDSDAYKALLRAALEAPKAPPEGEILSGVQTKLRQRSRGKFYGDGWSVSGRPTMAALAAVTLVLLLALAWFALGPSGVTK